VYKLREIHLEEWSHLPGIQKIIQGEYPRRFALLEGFNLPLGISWDSDLIEPTLLELKEQNLLLIGIDLYAIGISIKTEGIAFSMGLWDHFSFFDFNETSISIVTETTITILNSIGYSIRRLLTAPDIIVSVANKADGIYAECLSGSFKIG